MKKQSHMFSSDHMLPQEFGLIFLVCRIVVGGIKFAPSSSEMLDCSGDSSIECNFSSAIMYYSLGFVEEAKQLQTWRGGAY